MTQITPDSLAAWAVAEGHEIAWWKTARTVDGATVLALPPHDSLYVVELVPGHGSWTLRHGDPVAGGAELQSRTFPVDAADPLVLLESAARYLIAESARVLDQNPDWSAALAEAVEGLAAPLGFHYLSIAGAELRDRATLAAQRVEEAMSRQSEECSLPFESRLPVVRQAAVAPKRPQYQPPLDNSYFTPIARSRRPSRGAKQASSASPSRRGAGGRGAAIASLVIAAASYLLLQSWWSIVLGVAALVLGVYVLTRGGAGKALAIWAVVLASIALFVTIAVGSGLAT